MKKVSSYVMQDDQLFPRLTVYETFMFAAEVRLSPSISRSEKKRRVWKLLDQLGLQVNNQSMHPRLLLQSIMTNNSHLNSLEFHEFFLNYLHYFQIGHICFQIYSFITYFFAVLYISLPVSLIFLQFFSLNPTFFHLDNLCWMCLYHLDRSFISWSNRWHPGHPVPFL